jgi:hypothetical protein
MTLTATVGSSQALEAHEAGVQAIQKAMQPLGRVQPVFGLLIASDEYPLAQVLHGATSQAADIPWLGFSTSAEITTEGQQRRSVVAALFAGSEVSCQANWWEANGDGKASKARIQQATAKMLKSYLPNLSDGLLLFVAEGLRGQASVITQEFNLSLKRMAPVFAPCVIGWLAGGQISRGVTSQIGGNTAGSEGLAAARITGNFHACAGLACSWAPVGAYVKITSARGVNVQSLDELPPNEVYARWFGYKPGEWLVSPLNELVRLYPLGFQQQGDWPIQVHSPIRMESDGRLKMNTSVHSGRLAHLLVGSAAACAEAAEAAARQALQQLEEKLGSFKAVLALVLVDESWRMLMEANPGIEAVAVRDVIGNSVPIIGGYTYGQLVQLEGSPYLEAYNQYIQVVIFAEALEP